MSDNSAAHAEGYPGRALPPVNNSVEAAKEDKGATLRCVRQQTGLNRYPINTHEEEHKTHGPNN